VRDHLPPKPWVVAQPTVLLWLPSGSPRKAFSQDLVPLFVCYARDGSKAEHSFRVKSDLALEGDGH
jgi:hypothetical protein